MNLFGDHEIMFVARKRTLRAEPSTVLAARGGSSDGETEALEGDAQAAPFFAPLRVAVRVAGKPKVFWVFLKRRRGRPARGGGRIVLGGSRVLTH